MRLAVIGTGHVGLVAGVGFSEFGHDVTIVGEDEVLVAALQRGELDRYEPGLEPLLQDNLAAERVRFTTDLEAAVRAAEVVVIAIVTALSEDGTTDLTDLFRIADRIGKVLDDYKVIVTKSTVPVGTSDRLALRISAHSSTKFAVASNPAFLKEGDAVADFMKPDRIVIGTTDAGAEAILRRLYAPFVRTSNRIMVVDPRSAELAKFASSALLATRISFMNELSRLADQMGADVERVRRVLGADRRIGPHYLFVGPGYGGTYFHHDIATLLASAREMGQTLGVVEASQAANVAQVSTITHRLVRHLGALGGKRVALWGLAFKPRTDDIGYSPALRIIGELLDRGASVVVHDPRALERARAHFEHRVDYAEDMYGAVEGADALVLVTEWPAYRAPDFGGLAERMAGKVVVDGRNIYDAEEVKRAGLRYVGLGRHA